MLRLIGGIIAGVVVWIVAVTVLNLGLRYSWPAYHAVEQALTFTLPMMIARLTESGISSIVSGWASAAIARNRTAALWSGIVLLLPFAYFHSTIWNKFPVWYHLTFFVSLVVLSVLGGMLAGRRGAAQPA
jgi:hypothetical protein